MNLFKKILLAIESFETENGMKANLFTFTISTSLIMLFVDMINIVLPPVTAIVELLFFLSLLTSFILCVIAIMWIITTLAWHRFVTPHILSFIFERKVSHEDVPLALYPYSSFHQRTIVCK